MSKIGKQLLKRLGTFNTALEKKEVISNRFTCRRIELDLEPNCYTPRKVKDVRNSLSMSQAIFAQFLGVSVKTVSAWERGDKKPSDLACRFMDEIKESPDYWKRRLKTLVKPIRPAAV